MRQLIALLLLVACCAKASAMTTYHVGNSLTEDSRYYNLDDLAAQRGYDPHVWGQHIKCGSPLPNIWANPANVCVAPSAFGTFDAALPGNQWDSVILQSFKGTTLGDDTAAMLDFIELARSNSANAATKFYIYESWPTLSTIGSQWTESAVDSDSQPSRHSAAYYDLLLARVRAGTDAEVYVIPAGEVIYELTQRILAGQVTGLDAAGDIYRDDIHANYTGQFAALLTVWSTLYGESPEGLLPLFSVPPELHGIVWDVVSNSAYTGIPEPSTVVLLALTGMGMARRRNK